MVTQPIFAGKGVTTTIRHNPARKYRPQHNPPLFCEEHMIGAFCEWQMYNAAKIIMSKRHEMIALLAGSQNIILSDGRKIIMIKRVDEKGLQVRSLAF